jgi:5-methylcytosine-specific restriction endonuclease McrA
MKTKLSSEELRIRANARSALRMRRLRADPIIGPAMLAESRQRLERWRTEHPEKVKEIQRLRRARRDKKTNYGTVNLKHWLAVLAAFYNGCAVCSDKEHGLHKDHWIPLAHGGKHQNGNLIPLCPRCNREKSAQEPHEWLVLKEHGLVALARIETIRRRLVHV